MSRVAKIVAGGVVALLVLSIFLFSLIRRLRQWHRLSHIPGPRWAGFSRLAWLVPLSTSGKYTTWMRDIDKKYGRNQKEQPALLLSIILHKVVNTGVRPLGACWTENTRHVRLEVLETNHVCRVCIHQIRSIRRVSCRSTQRPCVFYHR